jgi:hypothetical protein
MCLDDEISVLTTGTNIQQLLGIDKNKRDCIRVFCLTASGDIEKYETSTIHSLGPSAI